ESNVKRGLLPSMGAEDFACFLEQKPGAYIWIGNGTAEAGGILHNPHYDFNDEVLPLGASYWVRLAESVLAKERAAAEAAEGSNAHYETRVETSTAGLLNAQHAARPGLRKATNAFPD